MIAAAQILLLVLFGAACAYTVIGYPHRYGALSSRSRLFRTIGLFLVDLLLGLVLLGTFVKWTEPVPGVSARAQIIRLAAFSLACVFLAFSLLCIAALDWLELQVVYRRARRDILYKQGQDATANRSGAEAERAPGGDNETKDQKPGDDGSAAG